MSIEELELVCPPPAAPIEAGRPEMIAAIESQLNIQLPQDIIDFGIRYGTGRFDHELRVFNPFDENYVLQLRDWSQTYANLREWEGPDFIEYPVYPETPGLVIWGTEVNGYKLFWLTEGEPAEWPTIFFSNDGLWHRFDMSATTFIANAIRGDIHFPPEVPVSLDHLRNLTFVPKDS